jgi:hypothetical protein
VPLLASHCEAIRCVDVRSAVIDVGRPLVIALLIKSDPVQPPIVRRTAERPMRARCAKRNTARHTAQQGPSVQLCQTKHSWTRRAINTPNKCCVDVPIDAFLRGHLTSSIAGVCLGMMVAHGNHNVHANHVIWVNKQGIACTRVGLVYRPSCVIRASVAAQTCP